MQERSITSSSLISNIGSKSSGISPIVWLPANGSRFFISVEMGIRNTGATGSAPRTDMIRIRSKGMQNGNLLAIREGISISSRVFVFSCVSVWSASPGTSVTVTASVGITIDGSVSTSSVGSFVLSRGRTPERSSSETCWNRAQAGFDAYRDRLSLYTVPPLLTRALSRWPRPRNNRVKVKRVTQEWNNRI